MATAGSNFFTFLERSNHWFSQDVERFFCAQHALIGDGGDGRLFWSHIVSDGVGNAAGLEAPDVSAEEWWIDGLDFVGGLVGRFVLVYSSSFQVEARTPM